MNAAVSPAMPQQVENHGRIIDAEADAGERSFALFTHLSGLLSIVSGVPLIGIVATAIMWRIRAKDSPFLDDHGREAVNFQCSQLAYFIGGIIAGVLISVLTVGILAPLVAIAGIVAVPALMVLNVVGCVRGAMAANRGEYYRYPMSIRFLNLDDA